MALLAVERGTEMSDINDVKTLMNKREELALQVETLKKQRDALNSEVKKWVERRDALNVKNSEIWNEVKIQKDKRDDVNETVNKLKKRRSEIISQLKTKREEYFTLRERGNNLLGRTSQSAGSVKHQIDKLDWEIQTNPIPPTEENKIIEQIRLLEKQLLIHKEAASLKERLTELRAELGILSIKSNETNSQIAEFANKSQEYHKKMFERVNEIKPLKEKADDAHRHFLECKKAANEIHRKYLETIEQIKIFNVKIKEIEDTEYNERLNKQIEKMVETASKKLKDNRKLTLEEFKLLKEKGLV